MKALPKHLQKAVANLSVTVQELVFEVALHSAGMPPELPLKTEREMRRAYRHDHMTPEDRDEVREYIYAKDPSLVDRYAVGVAVLAGRSSSEIDEFFGWDGVAGHKLQWLRRLVRRRQ